ncbi:MAG: DUF2062 domain-containing protein [Phycisphaerae bacterium]|nr:DUF2062 domain-containing protein [Phycisphaerae bacterium]
MNYRFRLLIRLRPVLRFIKFRILHVDDTPQQLARGVAAGFFVAYLPLLGLHLPFAFILAQLIRANKALAVAAVWISNPLTFVLIYYPSYRLGRMILPFFHQKPRVELNQIQEMLNQTFSLSYMIVNLFTLEYWKQVASVFTKIGLETCIGGIILGAVVAKIGYWVAYYFIIGYRTRKADRKQRNIV